MSGTEETDNSDKLLKEDSLPEYHKGDQLIGLKRIETAQPKVKAYPEFGRSVKKKYIKNIYDYFNSEKYNFVLRYSGQIPMEKVTPEDFMYIRVLGAGSFGSVSMVKKIDTGIYYAKKEIKKHYIVMTNKVEDARNEKRILQSVRFPFTVHMKFFYQDNINIYFVLPIVAGGELFYHLKKYGKLREGTAKFLVAQIVLGLEYLHFLGIIHRDLKLENILLDHYGYVKITDFGMCKLIGQRRTYTVCGTAEYMAPEVINNKGYSLAADWWSVGVIIFELCSGKTPFVASEVIQIFYLITNGIYRKPTYFSSVIGNLIDNLLQTDLTKRYGNLKNGILDIKSHEWFRNLHWLHLLNRKIFSPIVPFISDENDKSFFTPEKAPPTVNEPANFYANHFDNF